MWAMCEVCASDSEVCDIDCVSVLLTLCVLCDCYYDQYISISNNMYNINNISILTANGRSWPANENSNESHACGWRDSWRRDGDSNKPAMTKGVTSITMWK